MKKAIGIVLSILAAICVAAMVFYYVRAYRAEQQYVHSNSAAILAVAVDDLLVDNLRSLVSARSQKQSTKDSTTIAFLRDIWQAGVDIPARIYLYSLAEDPHTFYSVQKINDQAQWHIFLRKYTPDMEAPEEGIAIQLTKNIAMLRSGDRILFRFSLKDSSSSSFTAEALQQDDNWIKIRQLNAVKKLPKLDHVSYWTLNNKISLRAHIHHDNTEILGSWQVDKVLPQGRHEVRTFTQDNVALLFWSQLPISSMPSVPQTLSKFSSAINDTAYDKPRYMDLLICQQTVSQQDTIITYDYDENFNSIEKSTIQDIQVPLIESVWQSDSAFAQQLPDKMFYKLHKYQRDKVIILSTQDHLANAPTFEKNRDAYLFMLRLNFANWPESWSFGPFKFLQMRQVKAIVSAIAENTHQMEIKGKICYSSLNL